MKTLAYSFAGLVLAATAAHAQPAADPATEAEGPDAAATSAADATTPADAAEPVADAAPAPADDAVAASAEVSDADIDSFFEPEGIDVDFQVTFHPRLAVAPSGGASDRFDVAVRPK